MNRRTFLAASGGAIAGAGLVNAEQNEAQPAGAFALDYAPHFGMFSALAGDDLVDQLTFMRDQGFRSFEDNGMGGRPVAEQERIADAAERLGLRMGVFVASAHWGKKTFVHNDESVRTQLNQNMTKAVEVAKRVNATWCTVLLDEFDPRMEWDYQTANAVDNLRMCCEICEPHGLVMVLEPLNPWENHPGLFLTKIPQAYQICRAVDSPSCKILNDLYHQQITEGRLIGNIDAAWDETAYFQVGDTPGRREPTTGEINYSNVFAHIKAKGFTGIVGMEHGNSKDGKPGARGVIDAYRAVDPS